MAFEQAEQARQLLQQGIAAARGGRPERARDLLQQAVRLDPQNETTWLWLSSVAHDDKERLFCLKQLLTINPENQFALKGLRALGAEPATATQPTAATGIPILEEEKYTRLQSAIDAVLHDYVPLPPGSAGAEWTHKTRGRTGEGGAQRVRVAVFTLAALVVVALVGVLVVGGANVREMLTGESEVAAVPTRIFTATPTLTPTATPGGPTPTAFSATMAVPATQIPTGLPQGSVFGATPTDVYPALNPNIQIIEGAIDRFSVGDYPNAIGTLVVERGASSPHCYAQLVYYEAMSYAAQGGAQNLNRAAQVLEDALAYQPEDVRFSTCQDAPIALAGLASVRQAQGRSSEALDLAERALADDPKLVPALVVKVLALDDLGQADEAQSTLGQALTDFPHDTNLLLLAAQLALSEGQPASALDYVGRVLYIDPLLQPALQLQPQIYLQLADRASGQAREEYYGLAARSAETLLLYYPGDPAGYLYLAQARVGEGKDDQAEAALTRIIDAEDGLPDSAELVVDAAYRLRGDLYYHHGRLAEARGDLAQVAFGDAAALIQLAEIALRTGDYADATTRADEAVAADPADPDARLLQARLLVEICTFYPDVVGCEYDDMLDVLDDDFVSALGTQRARGDAYSYRAQAQYQLAARRSGSDDDQQDAYERALEDVTRALAVRETPVDHYYRGLILEALGEARPALAEYRWLAFWNALYAYPFVDDAFDAHMARLADQLAGVVPEEEVTAIPTETPDGSPEPAATATPSSSSPTPIRTPVATPTPVQTAAPIPPAPELP